MNGKKSKGIIQEAVDELMDSIKRQWWKYILVYSSITVILALVFPDKMQHPYFPIKMTPLCITPMVLTYNNRKIDPYSRSEQMGLAYKRLVIIFMLLALCSIIIIILRLVFNVDIYPYIS